jgi:hypothetical protein
MAQSKEYKECIKVYKKIGKIDISPEMNIFDMALYHHRASEETMNDAWYYEMEKEGDNTQDIIECTETLGEVLTFLKSAKKLEALTLKTQLLAIV